MDFNNDVTMRFVVVNNFYRGGSRFLGGCNDFNEAIGFVLGLEIDGSNWYTIYDNKTAQNVFTSSETGYGGYGSEDEIQDKDGA